MNMKEMVKLHCKTCGNLNDEPLTIYNEDSFDGAEIAAYDYGIIHWDNQIPAPCAKLVIRVESPFCCAVGGSFWAGYSDNQFVQAKLLSILSMDRYEAEIRVEVLDIKDRLAFVKPVSDEEKERMLETHTYVYCEPCGDAPNPQVIRDDPGILHFFNTCGGGDVNYDDYIYTDPDGIDHLILKEYSDFEGAYSFLGDEILGFHTDSPYQWENGLLIDWKSKTVIGCADGVTEAVIPQGIVRLGWFSFKSSSRLERITIPDSVTRIYHAFWQSPKEVILTGNSQLTENDLSEVRGAQIHRIP